MLSLQQGLIMYRKEKYYSELGTAQIATILANQQRQKNSDPIRTLNDFCFFLDREGEGDIPSSYYGSAAIALAEMGKLPTWALFCFKQLKDSADPTYVPAYPALIAEDCILLHPKRTQLGWMGLMIAAESASKQSREFTDIHGVAFTLMVPEIKTKFVAEEDVVLRSVS